MPTGHVALEMLRNQPRTNRALAVTRVEPNKSRALVVCTHRLPGQICPQTQSLGAKAMALETGGAPEARPAPARA